MTEEPFDLGVLERVVDPYPVLAELRASAPVRRTPDGFWAVTGHAEALDALRHPGCASSPVALRFLDGLPPGAARNEMSHRINFLDPPDHPRVRGLLSSAFTPRRVAALRPWIETTAARLVDGLRGRPEFDLLTELAHQLPSLVISELLGVPVEDRDRLTTFSDRTAPLLGLRSTAAQRADAVAAAEEFHAYLGALLDDRAARPGDDLLTELLAAEQPADAGDGAPSRLSRPELLSLAATLYSAGHRTTRDLFTNGMSVLLDDPSRWARVVAGEWAVPNVVGEFLRFETPTLYVVRVPLEPVDVGGVEVGPWEPLVVLLGAANRDPAVYDDPDEFRPDRDGPAPLSFAFGAHYCLGASLARSEAEVLLAAVAAAFPDLHDTAPRRGRRPWHQRGAFRGLDRLLVVP